MFNLLWKLELFEKRSSTKKDQIAMKFNFPTEKHQSTEQKQKLSEIFESTWLENFKLNFSEVFFTVFSKNPLRLNWVNYFSFSFKQTKSWAWDQTHNFRDKMTSFFLSFFVLKVDYFILVSSIVSTRIWVLHWTFCVFSCLTVSNHR